MSQTDAYIARLASLQEGDLSQLRRLADCPLDETLPGFDLFAGLWWPLRQQSPRTPRRETSWLIAKLYGAQPLPHVASDDNHRLTLAWLLGEREPRAPEAAERFRARFDILLQTPLAGLEAPLRWALSVVAEPISSRARAGLDWTRLLDDISAWESGPIGHHKRSVRETWAEHYLDACEKTNGGDSHAH